MTDISDKAVQEALDWFEPDEFDDPARINGDRKHLSVLKARIEADARAIRAASVIAHKRRPHWKDWDDLDAALAAREQVK
jgi:hypothetical protein